MSDREMIAHPVMQIQESYRLMSAAASLVSRVKSENRVPIQESVSSTRIWVSEISVDRLEM